MQASTQAYRHACRHSQVHTLACALVSVANIDNIHTKNGKTGYGENDIIGSVNLQRACQLLVSSI